MSQQPQWYDDTDPRPPYGGRPGPDRRPAGRARDSEPDRRASWSPRQNSVPGSFGQDGGGPSRPRSPGREGGSPSPPRSPGREGGSPSRPRRDNESDRPDSDLYLPDSYWPGDNPASDPYETGPRRLAGPGQDEEAGQAVPAGGRLAARREREAAESPPGPSWRWGQLSGWRGALIVFAAAVIGMVATVATHRDPGNLLGGFIVVATIVAALAVRPHSVHLLIPVPVLAYLAAALTAGLIHEQGAAPSRSGLTLSAAQWIAAGFITMTLATAVAVAATLIRWLLARRAAAAAPVPSPGPVAASRPTSRTVSPSGPDSASWARQPARREPPPGAEPPSWPWPEESGPWDKRGRRPGPPPPPFRPRPSAPPEPRGRREPPPPQPTFRPNPSAWPEPPERGRPGPASFGGPRGLTASR